jgi:GMP synthase (glutamine-hydrolysing)
VQRVPFQRRLFGLACWLGRFAGVCATGTRSPLGEVTEEKVKIVQEADYIYREEIAKAGLDKGLGQYFAALTNMRSVGVMGDFRTYDYAIALRAVNTSDFMTADAAQLPWEVLGKVTNRIVNEVKGVNRVMYDCTGKPPATIEFE